MADVARVTASAERAEVHWVRMPRVIYFNGSPCTLPLVLV